MPDKSVLQERLEDLLTEIEHDWAPAEYDPAKIVASTICQVGHVLLRAIEENTRHVAHMRLDAAEAREGPAKGKRKGKG